MKPPFAQGRALRYFCSDESRWGLKSLTGRVISLRGIKPVALLQWPREAFWLYGAVEPLTGAHFFYSFSQLDAVCCERFVEQFAAAFAESLNLLQLDPASAHIALEFNWRENVVPLFQPAHSPQLNPVERLWQDLRKHFKGQIFATLEQLQQALFAQLNALSHQTIASLTGYSYILDSLPI